MTFETALCEGTECATHVRTHSSHSRVAVKIPELRVQFAMEV